MTVAKERYTDRRRNLYPIGYLNSQLARPLSFVAVQFRLTPNMVSILSLLVSLVGFIAIARGFLWQGAATVYLGLLLDHADGQVARARNMGSTWGMYLDMVIDRIVEVGLIASLAVALGHSMGDPLQLDPLPWLLLTTTTVGAILTWRFLTAYNDVLFLRSHLLQTGTLPAPRDAAPIMKRPLIPFVYTRDWMILIWGIGTSMGWLQSTVALLLFIHLLQILEKLIVFKQRHSAPEADAGRILGKDYH